MTRFRMRSLVVFTFAVSLRALHAQPDLLQSGPMVGYGQMTEVMLWVQTRESAVVQIRFWENGKPSDSRLSQSMTTSAEDGFVAHILVRGLVPGKSYEYELLLNDQKIDRPYPLRFQTQPLWLWRTDPPEFSVAIGSCAYVNEPPWDRPGRPYGSDYGIFRSITAQKPDVMIWLGDNTYYREIDWNTVDGLMHRWTHTRSLEELQPLLGATHHYAIWDDHDFGPNNADRSYRLKQAALENHKRFWANQTYGLPDVPGIFGRFEWGDVEFFLLDNRYHRSPNSAPDDSLKTMFGESQLQWLLDCLLSSNVPFKIVAGGNQMLNPLHNYEALSGYSREYRRLLSFLKENAIPGVLFLTGDRHHSELICLKDSSFYPLYDYTSSSLTAGLGDPRNELDNPARVPGTLVYDAHTFGILRFAGPRKDRTMTLECRDTAGTPRWSHTIRASDLRPPAPR